MEVARGGEVLLPRGLLATELSGGLQQLAAALAAGAAVTLQVWQREQCETLNAWVQVVGYISSHFMSVLSTCADQDNHK